jgi:predicted nuclease of predicted toxin-antitoxin system
VKVLIDENLPPALARAFDALFAPQHEIVHLRKRFGPGVKDVEWITTLSREGRWVVISADRRITRNKSEYKCLSQLPPHRFLSVSRPK